MRSKTDSKEDGCLKTAPRLIQPKLANVEIPPLPAHSILKTVAESKHTPSAED
jgi:hypothetical protein